LRPYDPAYLAGFPAERHHLTVDEGLNAKRRDKDVIIKNRIERHAGRNLSGIGYKLSSSGIRYRRILLPVYILHYAYNGRAYKIVSCGLHGTTFGERPFAHGKLLAYAAALGAGAIALGVAYGLAGLP
ncbi:MAG: hypothetical protein AAFR50_06805, partial [Pseudomonadota bacterium]